MIVTDVRDGGGLPPKSASLPAKPSMRLRLLLPTSVSSPRPPLMFSMSVPALSASPVGPSSATPLRLTRIRHWRR